MQIVFQTGNNCLKVFITGRTAAAPESSPSLTAPHLTPCDVIKGATTSPAPLPKVLSERVEHPTTPSVFTAGGHKQRANQPVLGRSSWLSWAAPLWEHWMKNEDHKLFRERHEIKKKS